MDSDRWRALLADFGIARRVDDASGLTETNMAVGTVAYAAPEQLMGQTLDGRADQYSLAATAFELLTGSHMYQDVFHDIRNAMTLVQDDGIVCGDDLDVQRTECSESGLQHGIALHTDYQLDERTGTWYHPGVTAAVAELLGPVSVWEGFWAMRRADEAWKSVQLANIEDAVPAHLRSTEEVVPTLVVEGINGYNIIQADDAYVGIPASMGPLRIEDEPSLMMAMRVSIVGTSIDAVKEEIAVRSRSEPGPNQTRTSSAVFRQPGPTHRNSRDV